jgi:hypothetical protein
LAPFQQVPAEERVFMMERKAGMGAEAPGGVRGALSARRQGLLEAWLARTVDTYPRQAAQHLRAQRDPFRNPVGQALSEALPVLLDAVLGEGDLEVAGGSLDRIIRIRAVQDFTPGEALGFLFLLKGVIREALEAEGAPGVAASAIQAVEDRIDRLVLSGFDRYAACREQMAEIRVNEARRRLFVLERMHGADAPPASEQ